MSLRQVAISVCNDGNVSQLDVADQSPGGVYYRIEVYRASQPSGGYGVTLSGSRVEDICGKDFQTPHSNRVFRYMFSVGDNNTHKANLPILLEGREEFNPPGMPDGSWDIRIRDLDSKSTTYGSVIHVTAAPNGNPKGYDIKYDLRKADPNIKREPILSPLLGQISKINPSLPDLSIALEDIGPSIELINNEIKTKETPHTILSLSRSIKSVEIDKGIEDIKAAIWHPQFDTFRKNIDAYEAFGDFGAKAVHPGTNLIGPNASLAAESIFVRQYRAALILLGRITSPEMSGGANQPESLVLSKTTTNTRPGVYQIFVGAAINHIGIYKLGLDKVHSDYGGIPMKLAPGSRMENDSIPIADSWRCNQTLGEIADTYYLNDPPSSY
ncbi:hypothetical protein [Brevibacillus sp. VP]|uniref:hypothetical protein n=1 Tax=unclassified Brevibacillus TaxID=2684853 RepID=UPI000E2E4A80|nr:hypothetical protein [Brevibacillus sp. VP]RFB33413.1 hypothetical protein DZB91_14400 [Brevibacillus sp. VP]